MSSCNGPALADLLVMVPDLLPSYVLKQWYAPSAGVRALRLVSKEVGAAATTAATSCKIKLGMAASLPAKQIAALFTPTRLSSMDVMVDVSDGGQNCLSTAPLLEKCIHDMGCLVYGAGGAIKHVMYLTLAVRRMHLDTRSCRSPSYNFPLVAPSGIGIHYQAPRKAFALLAAAVPNLKTLHLRTQYGDVDLAAFGSHCPKLNDLTMSGDALALQGIDVALPNLTSLQLSSEYLTMGAYAKEYIERACMLLHGCSNLASLTIHFGGYHLSSDDQLDCPKEMWEQLPASLVEWYCNAGFSKLHKATTFLSKLQVISLGSLPEDCSNLPSFLHLAPKLQSLGIWSPFGERMDHELELMWDGNITEEELSRLKERLLGGFQVSSQRVSLTGSHQAITNMTTWLLPVEETISCRLCFNDFEVGDAKECLEQVVRVFPDVQNLVLGHDLDVEDEPWMDESVLSTLMSCKQLCRLDVYLQTSFTQAGLVGLCMGLPYLRLVYYWPCEGVDCAGVIAELASKGRKVVVNEIDLEHGDISDFFDE